MAIFRNALLCAAVALAPVACARHERQAAAAAPAEAEDPDAAKGEGFPKEAAYLAAGIAGIAAGIFLLSGLAAVAVVGAGR